MKDVRTRASRAMHSAIDSAMLSLKTASITAEAKNRFRISSFPFCPLLYAKRNGLDTTDYRLKYYSEVGTGVHNSIQQYLTVSAFGGKVMSNWTCECGSQQMTVKSSLKPCGCGKPLTAYSHTEIDVKYRQLTGHIDDIYLLPIKTASGKPAFMLADYKTTDLPDLPAKPAAPKKDAKKSSFMWDNEVSTSLTQLNKWKAACSKKYPLSYNVHQVSVYTTLLRKVKKLNIIGWALIYVDRSRPIMQSHDYYAVTHVWSKKDQRLWMDRIDRACDYEPDANRYAGIMLNRNPAIRANSQGAAKTALANLVKGRPCRTMDDFTTEMEPSFVYEKDGACPLMLHCLSGKSDKAVAAAIHKTPPMEF